MNRQQFLSRCFIAASALVSAVQGIFFTLQGVSAINGLGLTLAVLTMLWAWRWTRVPNTRIVQIVATLLAAQFAVFAVNFVLIQPPMPHRMLQVAIALSYGGTVLASLLSLFRRVEAVNVVLLPLSLGVALLLVEVLAGRVAAPSGSWVAPEQEAQDDDGSGPIAAHPIIGHHYRPHAFFKEYYPDNPRGYYREEDKALSKWVLSVNESSAARMLFPEQEGVDVRVDVTRAPSTPFWHIQLGQASFALRSGESYRLSFGVRADDSRSIIYAVSQAHEPWEDLGLYREIEVTGEWQEISSQFTRGLSEGHGIDDVHPLGQRLVDRTACGHLGEPGALCVVERSHDGHLGLDAFDPAVGSLIAVNTVVGVHPVELESDIDAGEGDLLVVGIQPQGDGDTGCQSSQ